MRFCADLCKLLFYLLFYGDEPPCLHPDRRPLRQSAALRQQADEEYIDDMSPVQYRTHADETMVIPLKFGRSHSIMTPPTPIDQ